MKLELRKTGMFEQDAKKLEGSMRKRLQKAVEKIAAAPQAGKPMRHAANIFSERIGHYRLVYRVKKEVLLLVCFKNRDEVYAILEKILRSEEF